MELAYPEAHTKLLSVVVNFPPLPKEKYSAHLPLYHPAEFMQWFSTSHASPLADEESQMLSRQVKRSAHSAAVDQSDPVSFPTQTPPLQIPL
jgi:hypothetical protein